MRGIIKAIGIVAAAILFAAIFAPKAFTPEKPPEQQLPAISLTLYFSDQDATELRAERRNVPHTNDPARTAMEELLAGARTPGLVSLIPAGTKLKSFSVQQGIAYVDLSGDILNTPNRGSTSENLIIASIVNTLTEFPNIEKVQLLIEGKEQETLYGHMDLSQPFTRFQ